MEERQATIDGITHPMPSPFLVIATQNPIEYEGTFALPEAQLDRFMLRLRLGYPKAMEEIVILDEQKRLHPIDDLRQVLDLEELRQMQIGDQGDLRRPDRGRVHRPAGHAPPASIRTSTSARRRAARSTSTASGQALAALDGRDYVIPDDVKQLAVAVLAHRLIIKSQASLREIDPDSIVREILAQVPIGEASSATARPSSAHSAARSARTWAAWRDSSAFVFLGTVLVVAAFSTGSTSSSSSSTCSAALLLGLVAGTRGAACRGLRAGYHVLNPRGQVGEVLQAVYRVDNETGWGKPWVELSERVDPAGAAAGPRDRGARRAAAGSGWPRSRCCAAARYRLGALRVRTGDPFGLFSSEMVVGQPTWVVVFPKVHRAAALAPAAVAGRRHRAVASPLRGGQPTGQQHPALRPWRRHQPHPLASACATASCT